MTLEKIIELTIRQKDGVTHTKFLLLPNGETFPSDNFNIAEAWMEQGLLSPKAAALIKKIQELTPDKVIVG